MRIDTRAGSRVKGYDGRLHWLEAPNGVAVDMCTCGHLCGTFTDTWACCECQHVGVLCFVCVERCE